MKIDHWLWCVKGLQGIVGMLTKLAAAKIPASTEALNQLRTHIAELQRITAAEQSPVQESPSGEPRL